MQSNLPDFQPKCSNSESHRKCGDVSISLETTSLTIHCVFCEFQENSLEYFLDHLKNQHFAMLALETILWPEATTNELHIKQEELELTETKLQDNVNVLTECAADPLMSDVQNINNSTIKTELRDIREPDEPEEKHDLDVDFNSDTKKPKPQHICRLIHYIRQHPTLWDTQLGEHYIRSERMSAIENITTQILKEYPSLSIDTKYVQNKFKDLKKIYFDYNKSKTKPNKNHEKYFELLHFLKDHEKSKETKKLCILCNKEVAYLPSHMQKHHCKIDTSKFLKCDVCEEMLPSEDNLQKHKRVVHRRFECKFCTRTPYTNPKSLRRHIQNTHPEVQLPPKKANYQGYIKERICEHCGRQFKSQINLKFHIRRVHLQLRPYVCTDCPRAFKAQEKLKSHRNSAHLNNREHVCDVCSKAFFDRKTMVQHKRLHSDEMNYVCRVCSKAFRQAPALHSHMKTHQ